MFARWDQMAKPFARIGKEITIAVKAGGPDPGDQPRAAPRHPERARRQHAQGQGRVGDQARARARTAPTTRRSSTRATRPHGVAVLVETATDNPTRTVANVRTHFSKGGGNMATSGSVAFMFKHMGVFRLDPEGIDPEDARARPDRPRPRGDGRGDRREGRAAARHPLRVRRLRPAAEGARGPRHHAASPPSPSTSR